MIADQQSPATSIFTACKNRSYHLSQTIPTWLKCPEVSEIIVVDWCSDDKTEEIIKQINSDKIKFISVIDSDPTWVQTKAFNLAARYTTNDIICKLDIDNKLEPDFFSFHKINPNIFYTGNWRRVRDSNESHLNGLLYIYKEAFFSVNGYNEFLRTYGGDDTDIQNRLKKNGYKQKFINNDKAYHIPHTNIERSPDAVKPIHLNISSQKNMLIGEKKPWDKHCPMSKFYVTENTPNKVICRQLEEEPKLTEQEDKGFKRNAMLHIYKERFDLSKSSGRQRIRVEEMTVDALEQLLDDTGRLPLAAVKPTLGLCNRLRALASFDALATKTKRRFQVCWEPSNGWSDEHFNDLFENRYIFISNDEFEEISQRALHLNDKIKLSPKDPNRYNFKKFKPRQLFKTMKFPEVSYEGGESLHRIVKENVINRHIWQYGRSYRNKVQKLRPVKPIRKKVGNIKKKFTPMTVGVHIRRGDALQSPLARMYAASSDDAFRNHMDRFIHSEPRTTFYLATDCPETEQIFRDEYGDRILRYEEKAFVESDFYKPKANQVDAMIDLYALANTPRMIGTQWSSFSKMASEIKGSRLIVATDNNKTATSDT